VESREGMDAPCEIYRARRLIRAMIQFSWEYGCDMCAVPHMLFRMFVPVWPLKRLRGALRCIAYVGSRCIKWSAPRLGAAHLLYLGRATICTVRSAIQCAVPSGFAGGIVSALQVAPIHRPRTRRLAYSVQLP